MPSKQEKARRKQLQKEMVQKEKLEFLKSLPLKQQIICNLFDHLDSKLGIKDCEHDYTITTKFLTSQRIEITEQLIKWFQDNGGYCDCEILCNIEEKFE